jgi:hypothetical protein
MTMACQVDRLANESFDAARFFRDPNKVCTTSGFAKKRLKL